MFERRSRKREKYFDKAIELYYGKNMSMKAIAQILGIGQKTVYRWIITFADENEKKCKAMNTPSKTNVPEPTSSEPKDVKALEARIKELEQKLHKAELKAEFYDEMINVAESKFNITIRKKAGTKQ